MSGSFHSPTELPTKIGKLEGRPTIALRQPAREHSATARICPNMVSDKMPRLLRHCRTDKQRCHLVYIPLLCFCYTQHCCLAGTYLAKGSTDSNAAALDKALTATLQYLSACSEPQAARCPGQLCHHSRTGSHLYSSLYQATSFLLTPVSLVQACTTSLLCHRQAKPEAAA